MTGTALGSLLTGVSTLGASGAAGLAATGAALLLTRGALPAGFAAAAGALAATAVLVADFFETLATALDAGAGVVFLVDVVTVFFGAGTLVLVGVLEVGLTGAVGFLAGATGALAALAELDLAADTGLAALPGFAFLVLVAFNSCLLIETQGPRLREV